jgi:hypothetical protein
VNVNELVTRELVRERYARYNRSGDKGRLAELAACFTEGGVLEARNTFAATGRQEIADTLAAVPIMSNPVAADGRSIRRMVRHYVASLRFESVTETRVASSAYFVVFDGEGADHWGTYRDQLARVGDEWLFEHRLVVIEGTRAGSVATGAL